MLHNHDVAEWFTAKPSQCSSSKSLRAKAWEQFRTASECFLDFSVCAFRKPKRISPSRCGDSMVFWWIGQHCQHLSWLNRQMESALGCHSSECNQEPCHVPVVNVLAVIELHVYTLPRLLPHFSYIYIYIYVINIYIYICYIYVIYICIYIYYIYICYIYYIYVILYIYIIYIQFLNIMTMLLQNTLFTMQQLPTAGIGAWPTSQGQDRPCIWALPRYW